MNIIIRKIKKRYNILYLSYLRYKISRINTVNDIINIFYSINYYHNFWSNTDAILELLIECFKKYPLNDIEMQKISLIQQEYNKCNNINGYASLTLWLAIIESLN